MSAKNLKEVFQALIDEFTTNSELKSFCASAFGRQPEIFIGVDPDDPPEIEAMPAIYISPGGRSRTRGMAYRSHSLLVWVAFMCKDERSNDQAQVLEGFEILDQFMNKIESALITKLQASSVAVSPNEGPSDMIAYPYFKGYLSYLIELPAALPQ